MGTEIWVGRILDMLVIINGLLIIFLFISFGLWCMCVASARVDRNNTHVDSEVYRKKNVK